MIIVSQDKSEIINFDNVFKLCIKNWSTYKESIPYKNFAIFAEKNSDKLADDFLGEYDTKERAKEVLQELVQALYLKSKVNITSDSIDLNTEEFYYMPKE